CQFKTSDLEFEQNVFDEAFIDIVDSTFIDQRIYTGFPEQGKPLYDSKGKWIGNDTIGQHLRDLEFELKRAHFEQDTLDLIIAVSHEGLINANTNLEKYNTKKYKFIHLENIDERLIDYRFLKEKFEKFGGALSFSNITFNENKTAGTLSVKYSCGGKCGLGYKVYLRKIDEKWIVAKTEETS